MTVTSGAIARLIGPAEIIADHSWPGTSTTVLRLRTPGGSEHILKSNTSTGSFEKEYAALAHWTPPLGRCAPQLLDVDTDAQALVMTAVPGRPMSALALTGREERLAYARAGALLARLHHAAPRTVLARFGPDRAAYIRAQLTGGTAPLTPHETNVLDQALDALENLPPQQAQPSHLDFTRRNLLWEASAAGVIDFETTRYEALGRDFLRITQRTLYHRPDLRREFYRGYGREPDREETNLVRICTVTDAAAITVTSTAQGRHAFAGEAHRILRAAARAWPDPLPGTALTHHRPRARTPTSSRYPRRPPER